MVSLVVPLVSRNLPEYAQPPPPSCEAQMVPRWWEGAVQLPPEKLQRLTLPF